MKHKMILLVCLLLTFGVQAQLSTAIRLNQVGFFVNGPKMAAVIGTSATSFSIKSTDRNTTYYTGNLSAESVWASSGESVKIADFSGYTFAGNYVLDVPGLGYSYTFSIGNNVLIDVNKKLTKAYYFQRCSAALPTQYAGVWARNLGHADNAVIVLPSAASTDRPAGTVVSSPKGWYDAGDYNLYITNSGIAVYSLLTAYEHYSDHFDTLNLNIPESGNTLPDILDQVKWNTDWMLTMQDPLDGGVYFKKTDPGFDGFELPEFDKATRYLCKKTTSSAFDFAASMAIAYRVFKSFDNTYATQCLDASKAAYGWAIANPNITFTNPAADGWYPAIVTGDYQDTDLSDEFEWAATELYIATKDETYYARSFKNTNSYILPNWNRTRTLGLISLAYHRKDLTAAGFADTTAIKNKVIAMATTFSDYQKNVSPYKIVMGQAGNAQFEWGSNGFAARQSFILLNAYKLNGNKDFLDAALSNIDYILGRNAVGYSFITGVGSNRPMHIHHRPSQGDAIAEPVPGWMVSGPSNVNYDGCTNYPSTPAISYFDQLACYTKNEVDINWNAVAVYATAATSMYQSYNGELVTGNESSIEKKTLTIFPNPFVSSIEIKGLSGTVSYSLIDVSGRTLDKGITDGTITTNLEAGVYQLILFSQTGKQIFKLVKTN